MNHVKSSKFNFTGQPIYIGLDVHKKSWSVSISTKYGQHKTFSQPPEVDKLVHYLHHHFPGALSCSAYEAGYCGFWIHDRLKEKGIGLLVVNPADVPTKNKERKGTYWRDHPTKPFAVEMVADRSLLEGGTKRFCSDDSF